MTGEAIMSFLRQRYPGFEVRTNAGPCGIAVALERSVGSGLAVNTALVNIVLEDFDFNAAVRAGNLISVITKRIDYLLGLDEREAQPANPASCQRYCVNPCTEVKP